MRNVLLLLGIAAFGLSGCISFDDRPISAADNAAVLQSRSLTDPKLAAFIERNSICKNARVPNMWSIEDLSLAAYYFNPDLDVARAQLAAAKGAGTTASAIPNPTVSLTPTYDTTTPPPWILGLGFDIPIETAGKRGYRENQAMHLTDAAIANLTAAAWKVRSGVRSAFLALYLARKRQPLLESQEAAESESVRIFEQLLKLGEISAFELTQSRIALNQIRFALRDNQAELINARTRLAAAIGVSQTALSDIEFDFGAFDAFPPAVTAQGARQQALIGRADIRAGLAQYAASQSTLQLEIAKQYPDIHLGPGYQRDQTDDKWTLGLTFALPIFNQNQGPIAEAEARRAEAAARFDALQTKVVADIDLAVTSYGAFLSKIDTAKSLTAELETQVRTADGMLKLGELSQIELTQRQLELITASLAQLDALAGAQGALGTLEDQLQSPQAVRAVNEAPPRNASAAPKSALTLRQVQSVPLPGVKGGFDLMAADIAGQRLFVDAEDNNTTEVINLAQERLEREIDGLHMPKWVVYLPELNRLYIANGDGGLRVFDATTYTLLHTITFREKANNLHYDPATHELFVGVGLTFGAIGIVDTTTDKIVGEIPLASSPNQFEFDGNFIYVNVPQANHVAVIDRRTHTVVATWPMTIAKDNLPMGLDRTHQRMFVGFKSGKLAVIDMRTGKIIATLDIAADADGIYYDVARARIYVSCGAGWIYVIGQSDLDHYNVIDRIATDEGAGTSLFVPELGRLFLPVPQNENHPAEVRIYAVSQQ